MNVCTFTGRLGADPETREIKEGLSVTEFRFVNNVKRNKEDVPLWITCYSWNRGDFGLGKNVIQPYAKKGALVAVTGTIELEEYKDKEGNSRSKLKLELADRGFDFLGTKADNEGKSEDPKPAPAPAAKKTATKKETVDETIPF